MQYDAKSFSLENHHPLKELAAAFPDRFRRLTKEGHVDCYEVTDALVFGLGHVGVAIGGRLFLVREALTDESYIDNAFAHLNGTTEITAQVPLPADTAYCKLHGNNSLGYFHWLNEYLPKAAICEAYGLKPAYLAKNAPHPRFGYMSETLNDLGIAPDKVHKLDYPLNCVYFAPRLYMPEVFYENRYDYSIEAPEKRRNFNSSLLTLRSLVLERVQTVPVNAGKRVYIARKSNGINRPTQIMNEADFLGCLDMYGFKPVYMEDLRFAEKVSIMRGAESIIGVMGAGMIHALFLPPKAVVIELFPPGRRWGGAYNASCFLDFKYFTLSSNFRDEGWEADNFNVDICALEVCLRTNFGTGNNY